MAVPIMVTDILMGIIAHQLWFGHRLSALVITLLLPAIMVEVAQMPVVGMVVEVTAVAGHVDPDNSR
ncbi:MAG: hypothetical protein BGO59_24290 [Spirosoma sp. 48-14]|nr:MAG: hypothetical protein BGO59_24290 [Spirosoma sp. 48-14]